MKVVVGLARGAGVVNGEWFVTARVSGQGPSRVKAKVRLLLRLVSCFQ